MSACKQIFYQVVFSAKNRQAAPTKAHSEELYEYIRGITKKRYCRLYRINGTEDHPHIFSDPHPCVSLSDCIKDMKQGSGNRMEESGRFLLFTGWQDGYCAFTYNLKKKPVISRPLA